jgi:hypothetical protein
VIIMINHTLYEEMDIESLLDRVNRPAVVVDGWHLFNSEIFVNIQGVSYLCTGF